ncbi:MAG TPA: DUF1330 domain-containing protein [Candidatus Baltobacteraceae bacterium]|nr:DUF1330 domain-containing protein [Candidatus Baltobacteraceae bacterium]
MAAYVIANIHVTDPAKYDAYKILAAASIAAHGGRYLARGGKHEVLEGHWSPHRLVILEFDTYEAAIGWHESQEYDAPKDLRQKIAVSEIVVVDGL